MASGLSQGSAECPGGYAWRPPALYPLCENFLCVLFKGAQARRARLPGGIGQLRTKCADPGATRPHRPARAAINPEGTVTQWGSPVSVGG
jgi:hypothetical protein